MKLFELADVSVKTGDRVLLHSIDLSIDQASSTVVVGPSGSGKTTLLKTLAGLLPEAFVVDGALSSTAQRIGYVPQDARGSLDPLWRVGFQLREVLTTHEPMSRRDATMRANQILRQVGFAEGDIDVVMKSFPHQLSGGMCQRVAIGLALITNPDVLLVDEPASMLDSASASDIFELLESQVSQSGCSIVVVTHDDVVASHLNADLYEVSDGTLSQSSVSVVQPGEIKHRVVVPEDNIVAFKDVRVRYSQSWVLDGLDLTIGRGETLALVGRSGCGKSTVVRTMLGLLNIESGKLHCPDRTSMGVVFQDPFASLDPRLNVSRSIREFASAANISLSDRDVVESLAAAGLDDTFLERVPATLSGGQLQRVAIARAIARKPELLLLDEPTSALDSQIRRSILETLAAVATTRTVSTLFVSHDLASVVNVADRVAVMDRGQIVEVGSPTEIFGNPTHQATKELLRVHP